MASMSKLLLAPTPRRCASILAVSMSTVMMAGVAFGQSDFSKINSVKAAGGTASSLKQQDVKSAVGTMRQNGPSTATNKQSKQQKQERQGVGKTAQQLKATDRAIRGEGSDKLGNFEIQQLMSDRNQAETLSSNVQKKVDQVRRCKNCF
jgi:hypothetical protein